MPSSPPWPPWRSGKGRPLADPRVTVVIITRNRRGELARTLERTAALPESPATVVLDNGSTDGTAAMARRRFPGVETVALPANHGAVARNIGVALSTTPYVAFCDDDTWWDPGSLTEAADALDRHPRLAVVTARIIVEPEGREDPICAELAASPLPVPPGQPGPALLSFLAGASVVRRRAFLAAGGFSPRIFIGGEEELLGVDLVEAGWHMAYLPRAAIHHHASDARDSHARRRVGIRNTFFYTWMRRPAADALRRSGAQLRLLPADRVSVAGCAEALAGVAGVARDRVTVSGRVAAQMRQLDPSQLGSPARRYVS